MGTLVLVFTHVDSHGPAPLSLSSQVAASSPSLQTGCGARSCGPGGPAYLWEEGSGARPPCLFLSHFPPTSAPCVPVWTPCNPHPGGQKPPASPWTWAGRCVLPHRSERTPPSPRLLSGLLLLCAPSALASRFEVL